MTGLISKEQISKKAFTYEINGKKFPKVVFLSDINKADEVDAAPIVHGHWIKGRFSFTTSLGTEGTDDEWCCSACGFSFNPNKRNIPCCPEPDFCERCGAKMDER